MKDIVLWYLKIVSIWILLTMNYKLVKIQKYKTLIYVKISQEISLFFLSSQSNLGSGGVLCVLSASYSAWSYHVDSWNWLKNHIKSILDLLSRFQYIIDVIGCNIRTFVTFKFFTLKFPFIMNFHVLRHWSYNSSTFSTNWCHF